MLSNFYRMSFLGHTLINRKDFLPQEEVVNKAKLSDKEENKSKRNHKKTTRNKSV